MPQYFVMMQTHTITATAEDERVQSTRSAFAIADIAVSSRIE